MPPKQPKKPPKKYASDAKTRAAELREEGRFGGVQPGSGRPRKRTTDSQQHPRPAAQAIAKAARDNADQIAQVFVDVLNDPEASDRQKVHAMQRLVGIEMKEAAIEADEARSAEPVPLDRDALIEGLAAKLSNPMVRKAFSDALSLPAPDTGQ